MRSTPATLRLRHPCPGSPGAWPAVVTALTLAVALGAGTAAAQMPLDLSACQYLTEHRPGPDVEYTPGVDVHGRAVAPADLPGSAAAGDLPIAIPVSLDFLRRMGVAVPRMGLPGGTEVGTLVYEQGRLTFNGVPLDSASQNRVYAFCRARR